MNLLCDRVMYRALSICVPVNRNTYCTVGVTEHENAGLRAKSVCLSQSHLLLLFDCFASLTVSYII